MKKKACSRGKGVIVHILRAVMGSRGTAELVQLRASPFASLC